MIESWQRHWEYNVCDGIVEMVEEYESDHGCGAHIDHIMRRLVFITNEDKETARRLFRRTLDDKRIHLDLIGRLVAGPAPIDEVRPPAQPFGEWLLTFLSHDDLTGEGKRIYDLAHDWQYDEEAPNWMGVEYNTLRDHLKALHACDEALRALEHAWCLYITGRGPAAVEKSREEAR